MLDAGSSFEWVQPAVINVDCDTPLGDSRLHWRCHIYAICNSCQRVIPKKNLIDRFFDVWPWVVVSPPQEPPVAQQTTLVNLN